jgi:hypothetical protein
VISAGIVCTASFEIITQTNGHFPLRLGRLNARAP